MSGTPTRLRASLRLRFAVLGAVALLLLGTSVIVAATAPASGPFTGCLAAKSALSSPVLKGQIYNVAQSATTPLAACNSGDPLVTFSNAQGPVGPAGPKGATGAAGATGPAGPAGPKGDTGLTGASGPAGPAGLKGEAGSAGPAGADGAAGATGAPGADGASLSAELLPAGDTRCGAAGGFEILSKPPNPNAPVSLGVLCNGAAGAQGPKGDPGSAGRTGPQGQAGGAFANLSDLNGTGCTKGSDPGTVQATVDATTGQVSILCVPTTTGGGGGGGGTQTNTTIGDCHWDDGSVNDADVPTSEPGSTGGCQNGTPTQTPLTNYALYDCKWDDGSPNDADVPPDQISGGILGIGGTKTVYTCSNGQLSATTTYQ